ncbi:BRISC and BRCA1-A complex member 1-like [Belonocnema kinseyi]|uniref:BRISC and BRCA1-A complex member 1-like n=1 Tax=Belonocnema kinseyi TaxID=2817044 RepID=UPI00143D5719|nr:BRISC and BRCA1-A complex member 1-like [Belonocnema kinseyi]
MSEEIGEEVAVLSEKLQMCSTSNSDALEKIKNTRSVFEGKNNLEIRSKMQTNNVKPVNVLERIIFIIDATIEPNATQFELGRGDKFPPLFMIKRVVEIFINAKSMINPNHEYALMILCGNDVRWIKKFTNNTTDFLAYVDDIEDAYNNCNVFELGKLFSEIEEVVVKKEPSFVTRALMIYCRSHAIPKFSSRINFENLMKRQRFFLDILYIHEHPSEDNECDRIYSALNALDVKSCAYIFEVGRNATRLHDHMVKLVAHPLQRPLQKDAHYSLQAHLASLQKEVHTNV